MRKFVSALALGAGMIAATSASAQVSAVNYVPVDNGGLVAGVTTDIAIDFAGQWSGSQLLLNLDSGAILRDAFGDPNGGAPNPVFIPTFPALDFDTSIRAGGVGAGAVDLGGAPARDFPAAGTSDATTISIAWNPAGGDVFADQTGFGTFRASLTPDANGTFQYLASAGGEITIESGQVVNGALVPEPTTAGLLGLAGLSLIARRRKTA